MESYTTNNRLERATKRVKDIKGFYIHAFVYVLVNIFIIISNSVVDHQGFANMDSYYTAIFWGFGLLAHGLAVFGAQMILGEEWEENKFKEIMNR